MSKRREELIDITLDVEGLIGGKNCRMVLIYVPHTTAGVCINEGADPYVGSDILRWLRKLVPYARSEFKHIEGNSDAHIKSVLVGNSVIVPVRNGKLLLGTWQRIFFCEFDGPRKRRIIVELF